MAYESTHLFEEGILLSLAFDKLVELLVDEPCLTLAEDVVDLLSRLLETLFLLQTQNLGVMLEFLRH